MQKTGLENEEQYLHCCTFSHLKLNGFTIRFLLCCCGLDPLEQGSLCPALKGEAGLAFDRWAAGFSAVGAVHWRVAAWLRLQSWQMTSQLLDLNKNAKRTFWKRQPYIYSYFILRFENICQTLTWKYKIMVQINPSTIDGLPSTTSVVLMLTSLIWQAK